MARKTYESRIEEAKAKIKEKPENALKEIGKLLVPEIKKNTPKDTGRLRKSIGYWYRKQEKDLQIGAKDWKAGMVEKGTSETPAQPFLESTVMEHLDDIQELIKQALAELNGDD